jgi:hypothetical protein
MKKDWAFTFLILRRGIKLLLLFLLFFTIGCAGDIPSFSPEPSVADKPPRTLQLFIQGKNEHLTFLGGLHPGDVVKLEARLDGLKIAPRWFTADPYAGTFTEEGELHIVGPGRFLIGAISDELSIYIVAEVSNSNPSENSEPPSSSHQPPSIASDPFMDEVVSFKPGPHAGFGADRIPDVVLGPPQGGGLLAGGTDVLSLGIGGEIVLKSDTPILNGAGVDFIVFENPFYAFGNSNNPFVEPAEVAVSQDGINFVSFSCDPENRDDLYPGCAGVHPVLANSETNNIDPTDPVVAGGDDFDLSTVGLDWALYIRIRDLSTSGTGTNSGFDLDAVSIVNQ